MRTVTLALAALCCVASALPASAQNAAPNAARNTAPNAARNAAPDATQELDQNEAGGSGYLPGARFERKLDGGPGFVCTATNALHNQQCTASCLAHETADCVDAEGSGTPSCTCATP